jgi:ribosomal protein S15P/S13E
VIACLVKQVENITEHPINNNFDIVSVNGVSIVVNKKQFTIDLDKIKSLFE